MLNCHVVVSGACASGKTQMAEQLARLLGTAYLSKDLLKEAMWERLQLKTERLFD